MKNLAILVACFGCASAVFTSRAVDLKQAKVTQVVNEVQIISADNETKKAAAVDDIFTIPNLLHTGPESRAELVAEDSTVTRVGANTIFTFDPSSRTVDLKQGSLLFHSPHGKGGGSIHTGSATASVLGSTLIVAATPNGGFKVISLEDGVQIKLANGLRQHLQPGQMTFILPGGKSLAPIVYFRMEDLASHSMLIKGFKRPLPSVHLIESEINQQNKLIKSGRLADTGLLVGNNATASQVEVLDRNTVRTAVHARVTAQDALAADATIKSSLTDVTIPTPPARIFLNPTFTLADNSFYVGRTFQGFAALNLTFSSPNAGPSGTSVSLKDFAGKPEFDFVADQNINFKTSVTFTDLSAKNLLAFVSGNQMIFAPGISLTGNAADLEFSTPNALTLNGVTLVNNLGNIGITSGDTLTLNDVAITKTGKLTLTAPKAINLDWSSGANNGPPADSSFITDAANGQVNLTAASGLLTVANTSFQTHVLTLNSPDGILLDGKGRTFTASGDGTAINLKASMTSPVSATVNNANLSNFSLVNLAANTITILNVIFGGNSIVNFESATGKVNVNGTKILGGLNIYNSFYGSTAITSASQIHVTTGPGTTPGIYSYGSGSGGGSTGCSDGGSDHQHETSGHKWSEKSHPTFNGQSRS